LYYLEGKNRFVLKKRKGCTLSSEYKNHKYVYELWKKEKNVLDFKIPRPYFLSKDTRYFVMQYIDNATNFQEILSQKQEATAHFFRAGQCVRQYHQLLTRTLINDRDSLELHPLMIRIKKRKSGHKIQEVLSQFDQSSYRIIFKDLTGANIILDNEKYIYLTDFLIINYYESVA
jgi:tRNA A-37 threonylcarbamoyl transferase component Bud32